MALTTIPLLGFSTPAVKAGEVVMPVRVADAQHNLRMPTSMARDWANAILLATEPPLKPAKDALRPLMLRRNGQI